MVDLQFFGADLQFFAVGLLLAYKLYIFLLLDYFHPRNDGFVYNATMFTLNWACANSVLGMCRHNWPSLWQLWWITMKLNLVRDIDSLSLPPPSETYLINIHAVENWNISFSIYYTFFSPSAWWIFATNCFSPTVKWLSLHFIHFYLSNEIHSKCVQIILITYTGEPLSEMIVWKSTVLACNKCIFYLDR